MARFLLPDLVLENLGFDLEVGEFFPQPLGFNAEVLSLLLANLDLLLHHDAPLDGDIVFGLQILQRRSRSPGLALKVVVGHLDVAQSELQGAVRFAERRDLLLEDILRGVCLGLGLLVLALLWVSESH